MAKELDDSLFEDVPYEAPAASDDLFDDTPHPESVAPVEAESSDPVGDATRGTMGGGLGAGLGYGVDAGLKKGGDLVMRNVGDLTADDIQKISDNRETYKAASPLESMLEQFRSLGESNRSGGIKAAADARKSLEGAAPIPVQEFYQTLAKPAENPKYSTEIAPDKAQQVLGDELDRLYPTLEDKQAAMSKTSSDLADVQNELNAPFVNERAEINQAAKEAKFENKLGQIDPKLTNSAQQTDTVDSAGDTFKGQKESRQLLRMNEKIAKLEAKAAERPKAVDALENIQKRKEDFLYNQKNAKTKTDTTRDVRNTKQFEAAQNRRTQLELNKIIEDEKAAQLKLVEEVKRKERLLEQKKSLEEKQFKIQQKIERSLNKAAEKADANFQNIKQAPEEIRQAAPFLDNRILGADYANSLENAISDVRHSDSISPVRLDQKLQEIRDDVPEGKMNTVGKFNSELSTAVKDDLQNRYPQYKEGMGKASESFKTEALFDKLGIQYNKDLDRVTLENSGRSRLNQILLNPDKYPQEYAYLQEALQDSSKSGNLANSVGDTLKNAEMSALKGDVARLRQGKELNAFDINSIAKGEYSRAPGIASKLGGTRLQELYAMYKDSKAANALKTGSKVGITGLGGVIGAMNAASAADEGSISPTQATSATLAESINPIPMTDSVESIKAGNEAYNDSLGQGDNEALANLKAAGGATAGFFKPATDMLGQVVPAADQALESGFKAIKNTLNATGMEQANAARARKEQNFKAAEPKLDEDFKSFVEQKPEQLHDLAAIFSAEPALQSFVAPLQKAADGDNRTRSAVLFGLYQQPAFRNALKNRKPTGM
jgi:hypothetical protein